jgi:hypothetical protein
MKQTKSDSYSKHFDNCVKIEHVGLHIVGTHHKKFGGKKKRKKHTLLSVKIRHSAKKMLCRVSVGDTRQRILKN